jgi:cell division protein FtsI/penicillin-binding protein 2
MKMLPYWRFLSIAVIMALVGAAIPMQIVRIQSSPEVAGVTGQGAYIWKTFYPARGEIYDRRGNLLAGNKTVYEVGVDLNAIPDMLVPAKNQVSSVPFEALKTSISSSVPPPLVK